MTRVCVVAATLACASGAASAQEINVSPAAQLGASLTTNRDRLFSGQEQGEAASTLVAALTVGRGGDGRAAVNGEYRLTLNQPLAGFGGDEEGGLEQNHDLGLRVAWRVTEQLSIDSGLSFFLGKQTFRFLRADAGVVADPVGAPPQSGVAPLPSVITARNQNMSLGLSTGPRLALGERDELALRLEAGWRRDFPTEILRGEVQDAGFGQTSDERDTFSAGLRLSWGHQLDPTLSTELALGVNSAIYDVVDIDSRTALLEGGARKALSEVWWVQGAAGVAATTSSNAQVDQGGTLITGTAGVAAGATWPGWALSMGYARGVVDSGAVGNTLVTDALNAELVYEHEQAVILRGTVQGAVAREAFIVTEVDDNPPIYGYGASAAALVSLVDWLGLEASYTYEGQLRDRAGLTREEALAIGAGVIHVHTFFVALSARAVLTPQGRAIDEPGIEP